MTDEKSLVSGFDTSAAEPRLDEGGVLGSIGRTGASRRQFIKGVIASGAVVSSAGYVFVVSGVVRWSSPLVGLRQEVWSG